MYSKALSPHVTNMSQLNFEGSCARLIVITFQLTFRPISRCNACMFLTGYLLQFVQMITFKILLHDAFSKPRKFLNFQVAFELCQIILPTLIQGVHRAPSCFYRALL